MRVLLAITDKGLCAKIK